MKKRWVFIPTLTLVVVLLIIGSLFDLDIAKAFYQQNSGVGHFFAGFVGFPLAMFGGVFAGGLIKLVVLKRYSKIWQNVISIIAGVVLIFGISFFSGMQMTSYHAYNFSSLFSIPIGLIPTLTGAVLGYIFFKYFDSPDFIKVCVFLTVVFVITVAIVEITKIGLPRIRYTSIIKVGEEYFRPWYNLGGIDKEMFEYVKQFGNEEHKSFPSGHSNMSMAVSFLLMYYPKIDKRFEKQQVLFYYLGFLYFILIASMRMLTGAHYLSDTMFAGMCAIIVYIISNEIYLRFLDKNKKEEKNEIEVAR